MKRIPQRELLDHDDGTPEEISGSLRDLRRINYWFGGIQTSEYLLRRGMQETGLRSAEVLEVAAGEGYSVCSAAANLQHDGYSLRITALDRRPSHLDCTNELRAVVGDALQLPFDANSFDFVSCCLFLHHLPPADVIRFITEALRVSRHAVLINDLVRGRVHLGLVYMGLPLFRSRITWHDAPASVRQAYTPQELSELIHQTPASRFDIAPRYLFRMAVTIWK